MPFFIRIISKSTGLFFYRYIHTETGSGRGMINGNFMTMMKILRAYVDAGFTVCTQTYLVCVLNYKGVGYNCIAEVMKHYHIHINALIDEHDVYINCLKNISWCKNEFEFVSDHNSIKLWSYSGPYVPGVFLCDENCAIEDH